MAHWGILDLILFLAAGYVTVSAFCRLMQRHREKVVDQLQKEWLAEQQRQKAAELRKRQQEIREAQQRRDKERLQRRVRAEVNSSQNSKVG